MSAEPPILHAIQASEGDCFLLEFLDGTERKFWLVDGGPATLRVIGSFRTTINCLFKTLNEKNVKELERMIVTHGDSDHTTGAYYILACLQRAKPPEKDATKPVFQTQRNLLWLEGYKQIRGENETAQAVFPIKHIWYNDRLNVRRYCGLSDGDSPGWMNKILTDKDNGIAKRFSGVTVPALNDEWEKEGIAGVGLSPGASPGAVIDPRTDFPHIARMLGPTNEEIRDPDLDDGLSTDPTLKKNYFNTAFWDYQTLEAMKTDGVNPFVNFREWEALDQKGKTKAGYDASAKNKSSIMFEFTYDYDGKPRKILLTGDGTGNTVDKTYTGVKEVTYDIIKLMHHGSSNNNVLHPGVPKAVKNAEEMLEISKAFFTKYKADKYVISSDTLQGSVNPDVYTMRGMAAALAGDTTTRALYTTNGLNYKGWDELNSMLNTKMKIYALNKGSDYASVVPTTNADIMKIYETDWLELSEESKWTEYFVTANLKSWETIPMKVGETKREKTIMNKIRKVALDPKKTVGKYPDNRKRKLEFNENLSTKLNKKRPEALKKADVGGIVTDNLVVRNLPVVSEDRMIVAAAPGAPAPGVTPPSVMSFAALSAPPTVTRLATPSPNTFNWHDVMISNLMDTTELTRKDLEDTYKDGPPPSTPYSSVAQDGVTQTWVDLVTFIRLLTDTNNASSSGALPFDPVYITKLNYWFTKTDDSGAIVEEDTVFASMLFCAMFGTDTATDLMVALPLDPHGTSTSLDPSQFFTSMTNAKYPGDVLFNGPAMQGMQVKNFRVRIKVPTAADILAGKGISASSLYFELAPPPAELNTGITDQDFRTWTLPYHNSIWQHGQIVFKHDTTKPIRIQMLWPFLQNAITFCHFDTELTITRGGSTQSLPAKGTMYLPRGKPAAYDIQLQSTDNTGTLDIMNLAQLFAPTAALAADILDNIASHVEVPGIDLSSIRNGLKLGDAGIILRQHNVRMRSVAIEDLYGTIDSKAIAGALDRSRVPLPSGLKLPENLPSLSVSIANITGANRSVSFALSHEIEDIGTAAIEVTLGANAQPAFDVFVITNPGQSVAGVLEKLSYGSFLSQFNAAGAMSGMIGSNLDHLYIPYIHLNFGPSTVYSKTPSLSLQQLTVSAEVDDIAIPNAKSPVFLLESLSLEICYNNPDESGNADMTVYGTASANIGGYDAVARFTMDHDAEVLQAILDDDDLSKIPTDTVDVALSFPNERPCIGWIIDGILNEVTDATDLNSLTKNIPTEWLPVLSGNNFQKLEAKLVKTTDNSGKASWDVAYFHIVVRLEGLGDLANMLPGISFEIPVMDVKIHYPGSSDPTKKGYEVYVASAFSIGTGLTNIYADFSSPPPNFGKNMQVLSVGMKAHEDYSGFPLGTLVDLFADKTLNALNINGRVPDNVKDVIDKVTVDEARLSFVKSDKWQMNWVEATVSSRAAISLSGWKPCSGMNVSISNVRLHFARDFGLPVGTSPARTPTTTVEFDAKLTAGSMVVDAVFTHDSANEAYTFALRSTKQIDLLAIVMDCLGDIGLGTIPSSVQDEINSLFAIKTSSFYFSYAKSPIEYYAFSNDGSIRLFGLDVSNIRITAQKTGASWGWEVSLALASPCKPFSADFLGFTIPGLSDIVIENGRFGLVKGGVASSVSVMSSSSVVMPSSDGTQIMLSGSIYFEQGGEFMKFIGKVVNLPKIDFAILPGDLKISIPPPKVGGVGLEIHDFKGNNILAITSFYFEVKSGTGGVPGYFGLGAAGAIHADWLAANDIVFSFTILLASDGGIGASFEIGEIMNPFHCPGLKLFKTAFSLVWQAETETPQLLAAQGGVELIEPGADPMTASFDFRMDETNPSSNYYKMDIENLTLPNVIKAFTNGKVPSPFDDDIFKIGFKQLKVDLEPGIGHIEIDADVYIFGIEGKAKVLADKATGIQAAAKLDKVNILNLIKLNAYHNSNIGPYMFLNTSWKDIAALGKGSAPPAWLGVTSADDPNLQNVLFALSGTLVFLNIELDVYAIVNTDGLIFVATEQGKLDIPDVADFYVKKEITANVNGEKANATVEYEYSFGLDIPSVSVFGHDIGGYSGKVIDLDDKISITVTYAAAEWIQDGLDFWVHVKVDVVGLSIDEKIKLDITVGKIEEIPGKIEDWIEHKVLEWIENQVLGPVKEIVDKGVEEAKEAANWLKDKWNVGVEETISFLTDIGHTLEDICSALADDLNLGMDEIATGLKDFGHEVNDIGEALSNTFETTGTEVVGALMSAGFSAEHALEAGLGLAAAELSKDINFIGNTISSLATDWADDVGGWVTTEASDIKGHLDDAGHWVENTAGDVAGHLNDAGDWVAGTAENALNTITGGGCVVA